MKVDLTITVGDSWSKGISACQSWRGELVVPAEFWKKLKRDTVSLD